MKQPLLLAIALYSTSIFSQAPTVDWQKNYGGSGLDQAFSVAQTDDLGYVIAGRTKSNDFDVTAQNHLGPNGTSPTDDFWIVKTQADGSVDWKKTFGGNEGDFAKSIQQTEDGGFIVAGYSFSNDADAVGNHGNQDALVIRLDVDGNVLWRKVYGGGPSDEAASIKQTSDGGYIICGLTESFNGDLAGIPGQLQDHWIIKIFSNGTIDWQRRIGGSAAENASNIKQTSDGGYIFAGTTNSQEVTGGNNLQNYMAVKLSAAGTTEWQYNFGGTGNDYAADVIQLSPNEYAIAGRANSNNIPGSNGLDDGWILKFNTAGAILWQRSLGGSFVDQISSLVKDSEGNIIASGQTNSSEIPGLHGNSIDAWLIKLNAANGDTIWQKAYGGSSDDFGLAVNVCQDGSLVLAGSAASTNGDTTQNYGDQDFWLVKMMPETLTTNKFGNIGMVVYPNPAEQNVNINLGDGAKVQTLIVSDAVGKTMIKKEQSGEFDVQNWAAGIYYLKCSDADGKFYRTTLIKK